MCADDAVALDGIDREECLGLLASQSVGRVAVAQRHEAPLVVPVNYVVEGDTVLFRSGYGTKLRALMARPVSFQVDWNDPRLQIGWSVLVHGRAEEIRVRDAGRSLPEPWVPDDRPYLIRVTIRAISGRRIRRPAAARDIAERAVLGADAGLEVATVCHEGDLSIIELTPS